MSTAKKFSVSMQPDVYQTLLEDSRRYGLSVSGYIAQLVMQKNLEMNAMRFASSFTAEQLQEAMRQQVGEQKGDAT